VALDVYREWLKIAAPERPLDHYALLGLTKFEDDRGVIQKNYRDRSSRARKYATGKFSKESQDLLDELARAMLTLTDPARKSEYDRKLGRKTKRPPLERRPLGQILAEEGVLTTGQLEDAQALAEQLGIDLRQALVQREYVGWEEATRALAQQHNLPYLDLAETTITPDLIGKVPADLARRESLLPLLIDDESLVVAVTHALNLEALETLRFRLNMPVRAVLCSPPGIRALLERHYGPAAKSAAAAKPSLDDEPEKPGFSLAGLLWGNVMWLGPLAVVLGLGAGYAAFELVGAVIGGVAAGLVLAALLFTAK
jgi:hypothetical protein